MHFELHNTSQSFTLFLNTKEGMYTKAHEALQKNNSAMRASGLLIGLSDLVLAVAAQVATIGEALIKGLANIFGALLGFKECSALKGLKQIFIQLPLHIISFPLLEIVGMITTPVAMAINPKNRLNSMKTYNNQLIEAITRLSQKDEIASSATDKVFMIQFA